MKFRTIAALALVLLLSLSLLGLTACKKNDESASAFSLHPDADGWPDGMQATSAPAPDNSGDSSAVSNGGGQAPVGQSPSGAEGQAGEDDQTMKTFTGVIDDAAMGRFYVTSADGQTIGFVYEGADLSALADTRPGSPVVVYYTGTLNGTDTSTITVVKMETP